METDETDHVLPFQLQFDKPVASQVKIAEWNPEKDLLAMVTEDSKILLHRFNWQRLWTISPGRNITSLCWRPDGKAIAVGLEDGTISLHDVENGKLKGQLIRDDSKTSSSYEDRTSRFFPPAPRIKMEAYALAYLVYFQSEKLIYTDFQFQLPFMDKQTPRQISNSSIYKVSLSKDLCRLIVLCSGELNENTESRESQMVRQGMHSLVLDTSIFSKRKSELHQLAQQASNIEDLTEVIRASLSVMCKQWSDAMRTFHEKFDSLSTLIIDHALDSSPQEEFLSLLGGARTSSAVHQFLVNSLGEVGVKRVLKVICGTAKELQRIVLDHLQPAAEIIGFRMGELRGLSRWRARYHGIGLDEMLINNATEKSGMILVQIERFMRVLSTVEQQFSNFFNWLLKCIKLLMQEPSDQLLPYNSELVVIFLKFLYDQDPVKQLLEVDHDIEVDLETMQRVKELVQFGGFSDCDYLQRTLAKEFQQMEDSFKEAFLMPFTTVSRKMLYEDLLALFPLPSSSTSASVSMAIPMSISSYEDASHAVSSHQTCQHSFVDYVCFQVPDEPFSDIANCIGIMRGFAHDLSSSKNGCTSLEAVLLYVPAGYECVDLSLYKDSQIVLLLNGASASSESSGDACMMIVQASELPFISISRSTNLNSWNLSQLKDSAVQLQMENEKVRNIPHSVIAPLAVSASRGVACVFAARKRALVYILEEDEEVPDTE
ncbi:hypothetical protein OIU76_029119 [Salix suchowensis]|nr:hypothetical protein OIU76_029119 [Salix suchowensis]